MARAQAAAAETEDATRVGPMHEAFAAFIKAERGVDITAEQVFAVTATRTKFRKSDAYRKGVKAAQDTARAEAAKAKAAAAAEREKAREAKAAEKAEKAAAKKAAASKKSEDALAEANATATKKSTPAKKTTGKKTAAKKTSGKSPF